MICNGEARTASRRCSRASTAGTRFHAARGALQLVQAVAEVRKARARHAADRRRRGARGARRRARACCRSGIVGVVGEFDAGDAVMIVPSPDGDGERPALAKGICNYAADELRQVLGSKSAAVRELLPRASEEAVHRDYLVLE